jgi:hypothetical protein
MEGDKETEKVERRHTLKEAAEIFYGGKISKKTLGREFKRHGIPLERIGVKYFVTASDIEALRVASKGKQGEICHAEDSQHASDCARPEPTDVLSGPLSMERERLARAALQTTLRELKKPSKPTSPSNTARQPANGARVISISQR